MGMGHGLHGRRACAAWAWVWGMGCMAVGHVPYGHGQGPWGHGRAVQLTISAARREGDSACPDEMALLLHPRAAALLGVKRSHESHEGNDFTSALALRATALRCAGPAVE
eukprot:203629-Chlamydomonas_euryale.AAC.3